MNNKDIFRNPTQELEHLTEEITDVKSTLKDISKKIGQIERHVKRAFGSQYNAKTTTKKCSTSTKPANHVLEEATIDGKQALNIFDELASIWSADSSQKVEERLLEMIIPNLKVMARELGVTFKGKPSKNSLCSGIMGRINERIMLSKNVNITKALNTKAKNINIDNNR